MRCGALSLQDCLTDHISRSLRNAVPGRLKDGAAPGSAPDNIRADCPACKHPCLTVTIGNHRRFVWTCHYDPACDRNAIRAAMIRVGIRECCLPAVKAMAAKRIPRTDAEIVRELRKLLDEPINGNAFRLRAAAVLMDVDAVAAADRLGIPERTRRRLLCP
jgi:hypothetical protein